MQIIEHILARSPTNAVRIHSGSRFLGVHAKGNSICLSVLSNGQNQLVTRNFEVHSAGDHIQKPGDTCHIGSAGLSNGQIVHVFERVS